MEICDKNTANRLKQTVPHTLGSKTIARKKRELEIQTGRSYSRAEMYSITHKKTDGSFVNDEAREKSELLDMHTDNTFEEDAYTKVFGKEHPGHVRGMGFGVCPSKVFGPTCSCGSSTMPLSSSATPSELDRLKSELQASNERVQVLEQEVAKVQASNERVQALEAQMTFLMQNFGGQLPSRINQVTDVSSPMEVRRSSEAGHEPQNHGPSSTI